MKPVYLDYNATTPIDKRVAETMRPYIDHIFGNPSSTHAYGLEANNAVIKARYQIAELIHASPDEIIFTSGGTESNNFAIKGAAMANRHKGRHIITTAVEHPAVTEVCKYLEKHGFETSYAGVDEYGRVDPGNIRNLIRPETVVISVMHANNEVGTIQPLEQIAQIASENNVLFHTDAAQSPGKIPVNVQSIKPDLLSIAGHKLYAPKGIGALYIKRGTLLEKLIHGADHEMDKRAGTESVILIAGLGEACKLAGEALSKNASHMKAMRDKLQQGISEIDPDARMNGHPEQRLPNTLSISFRGIEANNFLSQLKDVAASAGAACHTDSINTSSVVKAMKVPSDFAMGTIRFSTGKYTTEQEIDKAINSIRNVLGSFR